MTLGANMESGRSSSPHGEDQQTSSSPSFPFFNHDATTLPNNLPPSIDDRPVNRQKRKRTSPEDQAVLEAYYAHDPKPDKAARLDLVKRVALGEKEVQIWFQNRRQSSRRKSRPLLPHEIAQYQLAKSADTPEISSSSRFTSDALGDQHQSDDRGHDDARLPDSRSRSALPGGAHADQVKVHDDSSSPHRAQLPPIRSGDETGCNDQSALESQPSPQYTQHPNPLETPLTDHVPSDHLASRISAPFLDNTQSRNDSFVSGQQSFGARSPRRVRKSSSFIRLSMNSEGGAEVTAKNTSSPSPPRAPLTSQIIHTGVAPISIGSQLALSTSQTSSAAATLHRAPSGRSRDSRAWEFWCDKDCRSELEQKAEKDASGSAADAIQLLRSASGRSILGAIPVKRNAALLGHSTSSKRLRREGRMPLQRSSTTTGRLQGKHHGALEPGAKTMPRMKSSKSALSVQVPGNDSDKENWSPTSDLQSDEQSDIGTGQDGNHTGTKHRPAFDGRQPRTRRESSIDPENDPEIAAFMQAGRESGKASDHEELDCVQGLLSLSQGHWR